MHTQDRTDLDFPWLAMAARTRTGSLSQKIGWLATLLAIKGEELSLAVISRLDESCSSLRAQRQNGGFQVVQHKELQIHVRESFADHNETSHSSQRRM